MAQTFPVPLNTSSSIAQSISDASLGLQTLQSSFSGGTAPTDPTPVAGQLWYDETTARLMVYSGAVWLPAGGRLLQALTPVSNAGSSEEDLQSVTMAANTLAVNGQRIRITAVGHTASNANSRMFALNVGSTQIVTLNDFGNVAVVEFRIVCDLVRTGSGTQIASTMATRVDGTSPPQTVIRRNSLTESLTGAVVIKTRGDGVAASDVTSDLLLVDIIH